MPEDIDPDKMEEIQNSEDTWVIDFWADWCQPCHRLEPIFNEVAEEVEDANFGKLDMEAHQSLGTKLGIRALPTILIMRNGEEVSRRSGVMKKEQLKSWVEDNL
ncbi:MAG: thioredoxin [Candidatus Nanohaloarchaea archaeon]